MRRIAGACSVCHEMSDCELLAVAAGVNILRTMRRLVAPQLQANRDEAQLQLSRSSGNAAGILGLPPLRRMSCACAILFHSLSPSLR
jgi:hypothetical protein